MAKCPACQREMSDPNHGGCTFTHVKINGVVYKRDTENRFGGIGRCGDCGAPYGTPHHPNCDIEQCPVCGGQLLSCGCGGDDVQFMTEKGVKQNEKRSKIPRHIS